MSGSNSLGGPPDGELVFSAAGQTYAGWTGVSVTRTVEGMPARFQVQGTVKFPGELRGAIPINSPCTISIGGHVVITGYPSLMEDRFAETAAGLLPYRRARSDNGRSGVLAGRPVREAQGEVGCMRHQMRSGHEPAINGVSNTFLFRSCGDACGPTNF